MEQNVKQKNSIGYLFKIANFSKKSWVFSLICSIAGILLEAVPFISVYFIVSHVLENTNTPQLLTKDVFLFWGGLALVCLALSVMCTLIGGYVAHKHTFKLILEVRKKLLMHLGSLPMGYFTSTSTGEIQKNFESGMGKIESVLSHGIPNLAGAAPLLISLLIALFVLNPWLGLALLVPIVTAFAIQISAFSGEDMRNTAVENGEKSGKMNKYFNEFLKGITVIKIFGAGNQGVENLKNSVTDYEQFLLKFTKKIAMPYSVFKVLMLSMLTFVLPAATGLILLYGGEQQFILTILMFLIIIPCLYSPIMELIQLGTQIQESNVAIEQIENILNISPLPQASNPKEVNGYDISFEDVSFSYQNASDPLKRWALKNVSFTANVGTITALVGPSGGGKSSAGQLLCRFWDVNDGKITIGDVDIRNIPIDTLMDSIAFVFQDTFLFSGSVYENIAMNRPVSKEQVEQSAKNAMCHDFITNLPNGYDTKLGDGGHHLSGGEAQRIAIARAILKDSPIVVLDEATAFTDADNEAIIQKALNRLLKGKTVIMIAHRLSTIQNADAIIVMEKGEIKEKGRHESLLEENGIYKNLWEIQNKTQTWALGKSTNATSVTITGGTV